MLCKNITCKLEFIPKTVNQKYCSLKCANVDHVRRWRKKTQNFCKCGKKILPESSQCVNCAHSSKIAGKTTTIGVFRKKLSVKGKHPSWMHSHVRTLCRSWNKHLLKYNCQKCNYFLHIELCHIRPISDFEDNFTLGEVNREDNILVLCRNCHWEFDHKHLLLQSIPNRPTGSCTQIIPL